MAAARAREDRRLAGLLAALLAVLTLVVGAPQHVLDWDEDAGSAFAAVVHGAVHQVIDHQAPGHACAGHCAAHVMGAAPLAAAVAKSLARPLVWTWLRSRQGGSVKTGPPDRPPRA